MPCTYVLFSYHNTGCNTIPLLINEDTISPYFKQLLTKFNILVGDNYMLQEATMWN